MKYTPVIGLEIHVELKTKSKMFCQCDADYFGKEPNTNTCPVCLGLPGALPVPNRTAIEWTAKIGQALGCRINRHTKFDRKHYFYPDLPKSYQISQYDEPIAVNGQLRITNYELNQTKAYGITRVHLEEDTGKLTHSKDGTLVDFNRSSVPLVEIVTEPDFDNSDDVKRFLEELHTIIRYLEVSDADMEKGSMRLEPNISLSSITNYELRKKQLPNYKVEVKNINSFNFAKRAIDYELKRQAEILDAGNIPPQETRGYNEDKGVTYTQRSKENAHDYRYFPDPDIPPIVFSEKDLSDIHATITELPAEKVARFVKAYSMRSEDAFILTRSLQDADRFEEIVAVLTASKRLPESVRANLGQTVANTIINKKIASDTATDEFVSAFETMYRPIKVDQALLAQTISAVLRENPSQVAAYRSGKLGLMGYFVGQIMKQMHGKADPKQLPQLIADAIAQIKV